MFSPNSLPNVPLSRRNRSERAPRPSFSSGFTLTELVATVTILAIVAAFAIPNMSEMIANNNRTGRLNTMVGAVTFARGYAVTHNTSVTVCESSDGVLCNNDPGVPNTGAFEGGWIVFEDDKTRDGIRHPHTSADPADDEQLLKVFQSLGSGTAKFQLQKGTSSAVLGFVTFNAKGRPLGDARNAKFRYCDSRGATHARRVVVSATGQVATDEDSGTDLSCP